MPIHEAIPARVDRIARWMTGDFLIYTVDETGQGWSFKPHEVCLRTPQGWQAYGGQSLEKLALFSGSRVHILPGETASQSPRLGVTLPLGWREKIARWGDRWQWAHPWAGFP